jgi:hypothetical protein
LNEPGFEVGFYYLAILLSLLLIPAVVLAASARWGTPSFWTWWYKGVLILAGLAILSSFFIINEQPGDQRTYRAIVVGFAISTMVAAWAMDRIRRRQERSGVLTFLSAAIGIQLITALIIIIPNC